MEGDDARTHTYLVLALKMRDYKADIGMSNVHGLKTVRVVSVGDIPLGNALAATNPSDAIAAAKDILPTLDDTESSGQLVVVARITHVTKQEDVPGIKNAVPLHATPDGLAMHDNPAKKCRFLVSILPEATAPANLLVGDAPPIEDSDGEELSDYKTCRPLAGVECNPIIAETRADAENAAKHVKRCKPDCQVVISKIEATVSTGKRKRLALVSV